jgi:deoxyribodipyrimidine photo-lyase
MARLAVSASMMNGIGKSLPAPYWRVFSPTVQGKRLDLHGDYVRRYVRDLQEEDEKEIHEP